MNAVSLLRISWTDFNTSPGIALNQCDVASAHLVEDVLTWPVPGESYWRIGVSLYNGPGSGIVRHTRRSRRQPFARTIET
jgi:hypothetical protein